MYDPIAYTYEADYHCERCALKAYGRDENGDINGVDSEGNEIGAIAPWDEWWEPEEDLPQSLVCGTCMEVIETLTLEEGRI